MTKKMDTKFCLGIRRDVQKIGCLFFALWFIQISSAQLLLPQGSRFAFGADRIWDYRPAPVPPPMLSLQERRLRQLQINRLQRPAFNTAGFNRRQSGATGVRGGFSSRSSQTRGNVRNVRIGSNAGVTFRRTSDQGINGRIGKQPVVNRWQGGQSGNSAIRERSLTSRRVSSRIGTQQNQRAFVPPRTFQRGTTFGQRRKNTFVRNENTQTSSQRHGSIGDNQNIISNVRRPVSRTRLPTGVRTRVPNRLNNVRSITRTNSNSFSGSQRRMLDLRPTARAQQENRNVNRQTPTIQTITRPIPQVRSVVKPTPAFSPLATPKVVTRTRPRSTISNSSNRARFVHVPALGNSLRMPTSRRLPQFAGARPIGMMSPVSLSSSVWDGSVNGAPISLRRMGITHGSQLSPFAQELMFGDTIDPPDPPDPPQHKSSSSAGEEEVEVEDLPTTTVPPSTTSITTRMPTTPVVPVSSLVDSVAKKLVLILKHAKKAQNVVPTAKTADSKLEPLKSESSKVMSTSKTQLSTLSKPVTRPVKDFPVLNALVNQAPVSEVLKNMQAVPSNVTSVKINGPEGKIEAMRLQTPRTSLTAGKPDQFLRAVIPIATPTPRRIPSPPRPVKVQSNKSPDNLVSFSEHATVRQRQSFVPSDTRSVSTTARETQGSSIMSSERHNPNTVRTLTSNNVQRHASLPDENISRPPSLNALQISQNIRAKNIATSQVLRVNNLQTKNTQRIPRPPSAISTNASDISRLHPSTKTPEPHTNSSAYKPIVKAQTMSKPQLAQGKQSGRSQWIPRPQALSNVTATGNKHKTQSIPRPPAETKVSSSQVTHHAHNSPRLSSSPLSNLPQHKSLPNNNSPTSQALLNKKPAAIQSSLLQEARPNGVPTQTGNAAQSNPRSAATERGETVSASKDFLKVVEVKPSVSSQSVQPPPALVSLHHETQMLQDVSNDAQFLQAEALNAVETTTPEVKNTTNSVNLKIIPPPSTSSVHSLTAAFANILSSINQLWGGAITSTIAPTTTVTTTNLTTAGTGQEIEVELEDMTTTTITAASTTTTMLETTTVMPSSVSCDFSSPTFNCKGKDLFAAIESMGPWCVGKCKTGSCVADVCDCSCTVPKDPPRTKTTSKRKPKVGRKWRLKTTPVPTTEEPPEEEEIEAEDIVSTTIKPPPTTWDYFETTTKRMKPPPLRHSVEDAVTAEQLNINKPNVTWGSKVRKSRPRSRASARDTRPTMDTQSTPRPPPTWDPPPDRSRRDRWSRGRDPGPPREGTNSRFWDTPPDRRIRGGGWDADPSNPPPRSRGWRDPPPRGSRWRDSPGPRSQWDPPPSDRPWRSGSGDRPPRGRDRWGVDTTNSWRDTRQDWGPTSGPWRRDNPWQLRDRFGLRDRWRRPTTPSGEEAEGPEAND